VLVASEGDAVAAALGGTGRDVDEVVVSGDFDASRVADALSSGDVAAIVLAPPGLEIDQTVTSDRVDAVLSQAVWPLLQTVPTLAASAGQRPAHLLIVTRGRHQVRGDEEVVPELSLLTGPARVIPQEYPDVRVTELDFAADASPEVVAEACAAELAEADASAPVAYRDGVRYALTFEPARQTLGMRPWAASRSYLITGGLGGIGLAVAEDAARTPGVRLTLTHRSPLPTSEERRRLLHDVTIPVERRRRLEAMDRLEQSGAVVRFERADVTDVEAMRRVREQFGPFTGIVHAAGVPGGRLLPAIDHDHFSRVIDPKVRGTLNLDAVVADSATEWMVLCSSLASVVGGLGHTDYCSGNAFMDAFAAWRDAKGKRTVSLGYDMWTDVGMAVRESDRWLGARALLGRSDQIRLSPIEHPHFESEGRSGDIVEYHGTVAEGVDWIVDEHRLYGVALVPGTAILELLRAGAARGLGVEKVGLAEVDLLAPFEVGGAGPSRFAVVLEPDDDGGHSVRLASLPPRGDQWIDHALARVLEEVETPDHDPIREPAKTATQGDAPSPLASSAVSLGPRWDNVIKTERPSPDELILDCELSVDFLADLQKFWVHPALLDTAAGALLPLLDERPHLPMSYEYVDARRPMPSRVRSRIVRRHDAPLRSLMFDVLVQDEQGRDVLEMRGYTLRRIEAVAPPVQPRDAHENGSSTANRALASGTAGDLTSLDYIPVPRRRPGPGEVEVEVLATGLNFKEVLIAAGLLGSNAEAYHFGLECAGVVASVGPGVTRFHVGDSVAGMGPGCFSDFACLNQDLVSAIPPGLTYAQAASIPVAFTTAYDCLTNLAALESGETILVHAVTGGVGSAAAQVAHHLGARVFGTAGTEAKRAVARQMGVERVMDSRSTRFEAETLEAGGVDVVLNSLAGEFIHAGLRTLRPRGRFIELGRRDVESGSLLDLNLFAPGRTFAVYYPAPDSKEFIASFQSVMALCRDGSIEALPLHLFPSSRVVEAFGFMSRAEQVGKVVVGRSGADQVVGRGGAAGGASITRPTGVRALRWALALRRPHVVASPRPVGTIGEDEMVVAEHALEPAREAELRARGELRYDFVPPEGEVETRLADIWMSVLSLERVGREDRFLDLGGDSLYATQVAAKIRATFDVRVAPSQILADQPLRDLAERLDGEDVAVRA
jgi:NADPH:quinone reductase-like Zn-dependent oxidoreductase/acyl carrier protein